MNVVSICELCICKLDIEAKPVVTGYQCYVCGVESADFTAVQETVDYAVESGD